MKKTVRFAFSSLLLSLSLSSLSSCGLSYKNVASRVYTTDESLINSSPAVTDETATTLYLGKQKSDSLYVKKVANLSDDFIMGMDVSSILSEENSGVKYYENGKEVDLFDLVSRNGINYIRVRIWNDPFNSDGKGYGGGNNDLEAAIAIGKRATAANMKLLVDFHYSDFWADPSKQYAPKAWKDMELSEKSKALYNYTKDSLTKLVEAGIDVGMVQMGNETTSGMAGESWDNLGELWKSSSKAIREITPNALIAVHFTNPEKADAMVEKAEHLKEWGIDYDVFGTSYYPYWHGTIDNLTSVLSKVASTYGKKVMVMETSYCYSGEDSDGWSNTIGETSGYDTKPYPFTIAGQTNHIYNLTDAIVNHTTNGIGICYWEGAWISVGNTNKGYSYDANSVKWQKYGSGWAASYASEYDPNDAGQYYGGCAVDNQAFFDPDGNMLESLKVFNLMHFGNTDVPLYVEGAEVEEVTHYTDEDFALPETVNLIYNSNDRIATPVEWKQWLNSDGSVSNVQDIDAAKKAGNAQYTLLGKAQGYDEDVYCTLNIMEYNYVQNYSFETGDSTNWNVSVNNGAPVSNSNNQAQVKSENKKSGKYAFHYWTSLDAGANIDLEQEISGLRNDGEYKLQVSMLGGGKSTSSQSDDTQNHYIYVKMNGEIVDQEKIHITNYGAGFQTVVLEGVHCKKDDKVVIGIHIEDKEAGCWGDVDDVMFNYVGE